jgi:excisionase family DNA binding protein
MSATPPSPLLTIREVAALVRVAPETVRGWCIAGTIEAVKIGGVWRIPRSTLGAWAAVITLPSYPRNANPPDEPESCGKLLANITSEIITQRAAAEALGVDRSTISDWYASGKLNSVRTGEHRVATRVVADQRYHALLERRQTVG